MKSETKTETDSEGNSTTTTTETTDPKTDNGATETEKTDTTTETDGEGEKFTRTETKTLRDGDGRIVKETITVYERASETATEETLVSTTIVDYIYDGDTVVKKITTVYDEIGNILSKKVEEFSKTPDGKDKTTTTETDGEGNTTTTETETDGEGNSTTTTTETDGEGNEHKTYTKSTTQKIPFSETDSRIEKIIVTEIAVDENGVEIVGEGAKKTITVTTYEYDGDTDTVTTETIDVYDGSYDPAAPEANRVSHKVIKHGAESTPKPVEKTDSETTEKKDGEEVDKSHTETIVDANGVTITTVYDKYGNMISRTESYKSPDGLNSTTTVYEYTRNSDGTYSFVKSTETKITSRSEQGMEDGVRVITTTVTTTVNLS